MINTRIVTGDASSFPLPRIDFCRIAFVLLACFPSFSVTRAQEAAASGVVTGRVSNAGTNGYLEGAVGCAISMI